MPNQFNSAPPDAATARRLTAIAVQVEELARARRRALTLAPVTLLVLANVTPLVIGHHRNDPDEQYTLLQLMRGAVPALPTGLFLLLGVVGLGCLGAAIAAGRSPGRAGIRAIVALGSSLLVVLLVAVLVVAAGGTRNTTYLMLTPATVLGAAAAIWLIIGSVGLRR